MYEIQQMKIRSSAAPLDPLSKADGRGRRFFEWSVDPDGGHVEEWKNSGKWTGMKAERAWVHTVSQITAVQHI